MQRPKGSLLGRAPGKRDVIRYMRHDAPAQCRMTPRPSELRESNRNPGPSPANSRIGMLGTGRPVPLPGAVFVARSYVKRAPAASPASLAQSAAGVFPPPAGRTRLTRI